jgi:hypothetical protein
VDDDVARRLLELRAARATWNLVRLLSARRDLVSTIARTIGVEEAAIRSLLISIGLLVDLRDLTPERTLIRVYLAALCIEAFAM